MSIKKFATSAIVAASMVAANLAPLAVTAASAKDWRKGHHDHRYARSYDGPRHHHHRHDYYRYKRDRDRSGKNVAKGIAIGLGILAVGSILAHGAHR